MSRPGTPYALQSWGANLVGVDADVPHGTFDLGFIDEFDEHVRPICARGMGELGGSGIAAAIANAIHDPVRVREVPILPYPVDALA